MQSSLLVVNDCEEHLCRLHITRDERHWHVCMRAERLACTQYTCVCYFVSDALRLFHAHALILEGMLIWLTYLITWVDGSSTPW